MLGTRCGVRLVSIAVLAGSVSMLFSLSAAAHAAAATAPAGLCAQARQLSLLGDPAGAIAAVKALRAIGAPTEAPSVCARAYAKALKRQTTAVQLVAWANALEEAYENETSRATSAASTEPVTVPPPSPVPTGCSGGGAVTATSPLDEAGVKQAVSLAVSEARACDRANKAAAALAASAAPSTDTVPQRSNSAWKDFRDRELDPWLPLALALLGWLAIVLVVARLLLWVPRWLPPPTEPPAPSPTAKSVWFRPVIGVWGSVLALLSGSLVTGLASLMGIHGPDVQVAWVTLLVVGVLVLLAGFLMGERLASARAALRLDVTGAVLAVLGLVLILAGPDLSGSLAPHPWWGALVGVAAAIALAKFWATGAGLTVTTTGEQAPTPEYLRTLALQLGSGPPRGLEIPVGPDVKDVLTSIGISESPANPLLAAVVQVLKLAQPPTPWQLKVVSHSKDLWSADLSRNHRSMATENISRGQLLRMPDDVDKDASTTLELAPFAAALAVVKVALATDATPAGLAGATHWQSVGLQYLGSLRPRGDPLAVPLFASAMAADPDNLLARISYWYSLYREATESAELEHYSDLLDRELDRPRLEDEEPALRLRLLYTRVTVGVNRCYTEPTTREGLDERVEELRATLNRKVSGAHFPENFRRNAEALLRAVPPPTPGPATEAGAAQEPENNGPGVNYSLGCYFAMVQSVSGAPRDGGRAVRHLKLADVDPVLAEWRTKDPQLRAFRDVSNGLYRDAFGDPVPDDILGVAPFSDHATRLREAGFGTLARLSLATRRDLWRMNVRGAAATWFLELAALGRSLVSDDALKEFAVPIVETFVDEGYSSRPEDPALTSLKEAILARFESLKSAPDETDLESWLTREGEQAPGGA